MKKKIAALLSVVLLVCSLLTVNVCAATAKESTTNRSMKVTAKCELPKVTVSVVVPSSTKSYVNPSKVTVTLKNYTLDAQIVSELSYIENKSTVPIAVSASVTGTINSGSKLKFTTSSTAGSSSTAKLAFVFFQMQAVADPDKIVESDWDQTYDANKHILVTTSTKTKSDIVILDKYDEDNENNGAKRFGAFTLSGDCIQTPADAWTAKDGFSTKVAFTFRALPYDTEVD